jgi:hypothetical protein
MCRTHVAMAVVCALSFADIPLASAQPFPSGGSPNPAMTGAVAASPPSAQARAPQVTSVQGSAPTGASPVPAAAAVAAAGSLPPNSAPRAVTAARATSIPSCTVFVDAAAGGGAGTAQSPHRTIAAAIAAAAPGAIICVAEGVYPEQLKPGEKYFTLAGGFQRGASFAVRDSARFVSKAQGRGGSFLRIEDPGPKAGQLTAIDGFEITGYSQAIVRDVYYSQKFDITNNHIHDNTCTDQSLAGSGFALNNVSGRIEGNVFSKNACGRGGAGFVNDSANENTIAIERNLIDGNSGTEPETAHGGGLYLFGNTLRITGNTFTRNIVTSWGAGLYVGAAVASGQRTTATLSWNVYMANAAGVAGGGMFCDDGATCISSHEVYYRNCGGNIFLDSGGAGPTTARFDHLTNVGALAVGCQAPGPGVRIDRADQAPDTYSFVNAIFWGNAPGMDFAANCDANCGNVRVNVSYSLVQTQYAKNGLTVTFGAGNVAPVDPMFAAMETGDFHLKSAAGRWTPQGFVQDAVTSPLFGLSSAEGGGKRSELGAYGNSGEASRAP